MSEELRIENCELRIGPLTEPTGAGADRNRSSMAQLKILNSQFSIPPLPASHTKYADGKRRAHLVTTTVLPRPARNERGEGWGEGYPVEWASSPQPSPPVGEERELISSGSMVVVTRRARKRIEWTKAFRCWVNRSSIPVRSGTALFAYWAVPDPNCFRSFVGCSYCRSARSAAVLGSSNVSTPKGTHPNQKPDPRKERRAPPRTTTHDTPPNNPQPPNDHRQ